MRVRPESEQVDHHHLAVAIPARLQKAGLRPPPVRQNPRILGQPVPVDAIEDLMCQPLDFRILEIPAAGEHAAQENRRVDRRDLRIPFPLAGGDVGPVVEEAAMVWYLFPQEAQTTNRPIDRLIVGHEPPRVTNTQRRQPESGRGNAAELVLVIGHAEAAAVPRNARVRIGLFPEVQERGLLQLLQELVVVGGQRLGNRGARQCEAPGRIVLRTQSGRRQAESRRRGQCEGRREVAQQRSSRPHMSSAHMSALDLARKAPHVAS